MGRFGCFRRLRNLKMGEWGDFGVGTDFGVFDHAVGTDFDVVAEFNFAFDDDVDVNHDILSVFQTAS